MSTSVHKLSGNCQSAMGYYKVDDREMSLEGLDRSLSYYSDAQEGSDMVFNAAWGSLAERLHLTHGVNKETFEQLWKGQINGKQVVIPGRMRKVEDSDAKIWHDRTSAFDITFTTPKSIAEALVKATPEERALITQDFVASVKTAFKVGIEDYGRVARVPQKGAARPDTKQQGSVTERQTADLIAFPVVQYIARPTEEQRMRGSPPDPHLHLHLLTMTLCEKDGRYYTADSGGLKNENAGQIREAIFANDFTQRLQRRGYDVTFDDFDFARQGKVGWELTESEPALRKFWSSNTRRAHEIRRKFEQREGRPMKDFEYRRYMDSSRLKKTALDSEQDVRPVFERWGQDAERHGFDISPFTRKKYSMPPSTMVAVRELDRRLLDSNGLHVNDAVFSFESIDVAVQRCSIGLGLSQTMLARRTAELHRDLVLVRDSNEPLARYYTTQMMLDTEQRIEDHFAERAAAHSLVNIGGVAGSGKTFLTGIAIARTRGRSARVPTSPEQRPAIDAITQMMSGGIDQVVSVSTAAAVSERTGRKIGADRHGSVESVVHQVKHGQILPSSRTLVVVDEAGQMDTLRISKLMQAMGPEAKWILLGDTKQLPSISAGGWYASQLEQNGAFELAQNKRQRDPADRHVADLVRNNQAPLALENLESRGRLNVAADRSQMVSMVTAKYDELLARPGVRVQDVRIVVEESNLVTDQLNRFVQYRRLNAGELDPTQKATLNEAPSLENSRSWDVYANDQIVFTRAFTPADGRSSVRNGTEGIVRRVTSSHMEVEVQHGRRRPMVDVPIEGPAYFAPAYAQHNFKFQGHEASYVLAVPSSAVGTANSGYTLVSRGEQETHLFLSKLPEGKDAVAELGRAWNSAVIKQTALSRMRLEQGNNGPDPDRNLSKIRREQTSRKVLEVINEASSPLIAERVATAHKFDRLVERHIEVSKRHQHADDILWDSVIGTDPLHAYDPAEVVLNEYNRLISPSEIAWEEQAKSHKVDQNRKPPEPPMNPPHLKP